MSYYDIDDILSDSQRIPCKFNITIPGLGYLNGQPGKKIKKGAKAELPLWLAEVLAICYINSGNDNGDNDDDDDDDDTDPDTRFIDFAEPDFFSNKVLNAIKADPVSIDLHSILTNFYKMVIKWGEMFTGEELANLASQLLIARSCEINDISLSLSSTSSSSSSSNHKDDVKLLQNDQFLRNLDDFEKNLFKICHQSYKEMKFYLRNKQ